MTDRDVLRFVTRELPPPPARVLEVGAGQGELANELRALGYDVLAIDPATESAAVERTALIDVEAPAAFFDAVLAVRSLHHVEPLAESLARLAELVRPGGRLVVDEYDVEAFDERCARWLIERSDHHDHDPAAMVTDLRAHLHSIARLREDLARWFDLGEVEHGPSLYRWDRLPPGLRSEEEAAIARGELPATGSRFIGVPKLTTRDLDI